MIRDVNAGEIIILKKQGNTVDLESKQYKDNLLTPCLFEYLYFAQIMIRVLMVFQFILPDMK